jgi:hypothetical protein
MVGGQTNQNRLSAVCDVFPITAGGGEGFFEDGLEEVGGVGAAVRDFCRQRPDAEIKPQPDQPPAVWIS